MQGVRARNFETRVEKARFGWWQSMLMPVTPILYFGNEEAGASNALGSRRCDMTVVVTALGPVC